MTQRVSGKVARLVSDREVVLNRGSLDGVEEGMYFKVLDAKLVDITDPDSGAVIGSLSRIKIVLQAADVADHITVAKTFRSEEVNIGGDLRTSLGAMFSPPKYVSRVETLRRGENDAAPIGETESIVSVGDPFEQASRDEVDAARSVSLWRERRLGELASDD